MSEEETLPVSETGASLEELLNGKKFVQLSALQLRSFDFALTTSDNFFDPFENFESWFAFDQANNYNSSGLIDRLAFTVTDLGNNLEKESSVNAMQDAIRLDLTGKRRIIVRPVDNVPADDEEIV